MTDVPSPGTPDEPVDEPVDATVPSPEDRVARRARRAAEVRRAFAAVGSAAAVLAVTGGVVLADDTLPAADPGTVAARVVDVPPAPTVLVCPGPLRVPTELGEGDDLAYDPQFDTAPDASAATLGALVTGAADGALAGPDGSSPVPAGAPTTVDDPGAVTLTVPGQEEQPPVAASVVTSTGTGDLRGVAAAACAPPAAEHWLVGGSTALGSGARLVLRNPGRTPATVRLDVWGPAGPIDVSGAPEFLVPAGEERVVLLEGVAAEQRRVVVRTTVSGGLVHAYLQDTELRGLTPAGVALVTAGAAPATEQVVAGIDVDPSEPGGQDAAVLRLLAPEDGGTVRVALLGEDGPVDLPGTAEVRLDAGAVLDVPLGGLPKGVYGAVVSPDVPVVAGAMVTRGESGGAADPSVLDPLDRAWLPAQTPGAAGALAVPPVVPRHLVLTAPGDDDARVTVRAHDADGEVTPTEVTVPGRSTTRLSFGSLADPAPVAVEVLGDGVVWSVSLTKEIADGDHVAALTPPVRPARQEHIAVDVR